MNTQDCFFIDVSSDNEKIKKITILKVKSDSELKFSSSGHLAIDIDTCTEDVKYWKQVIKIFSYNDEEGKNK